MKILIGMVILVTVSLSHATDPRAKKHVNRDIDGCEKSASKKHTWIIDSSDWRRVYNQCLKEKLAKLDPIYIRMTLEAQRLEALCPENTLNQQPIELSRLGLTAALQIEKKEMNKRGTSNTLEQTLELYYERTFQSKQRINELKK